MRLLRKLISTNVVRILMVLAMAPAAAFVFLKVLGHLDPGPVSAMSRSTEMLGGYESHASFEQECTHCHAPIHCITDSKCQKCHQDVAQQRAEAQGLHSLLPGTTKCQTCHVEHQGRDVSITEMPLTNVDHAALTGFSLEHHAQDYEGNPVYCEDCHRYRLFKAEEIDCRACHESDNEGEVTGHTIRFGDECLLCHDGFDRMTDFDHAAVYALEGQHTSADCEACHVDRIFTGTATDCVGCHAEDEPDHHKDSFGEQCIRCHDAVAWAPAKLRVHAFRLDHGGESIDCQTCHLASYTEHTCVACHEYDEATIIEQHADVEGEVTIETCTQCHVTGVEDEIVGSNETSALTSGAAREATP